MSKRRCPVCRGGTKEEKAADGRPLYVCLKCDHRWTQGLKGDGQDD